MRFISIFNTVRTLRDRLAIGNELQIRNEIAWRQLTAGELKEYSNLLNDTKENIEHLMDEIAQQARITLKQIRDYLDDFSKLDIQETQKTSHIFNAIIGHFFNAYSYEINWQTTENMYLMRFPVIRDLQLDYEDLKPSTRKINRDVSYWRSSHLDSVLIHNQEFIQLLNILFNRINSPSCLYQQVVTASVPVFELLKIHRSKLQAAINDLERLLGRNQIEEVKMEESPKLYNEYRSFLNKLKFYENFYLIESWTKLNMKDCYLSRILLLGLFLILLDRYKAWGMYIAA